MVAMIAAVAPATSVARSSSEAALLDALAHVPATSASLLAREPISYVDYRGVEAARPGALAPTSLAELLERHETGDPAADLWFAASMGIASGPSDLLVGLLNGGTAWPEVVGFDFTDIDRAIAFGAPPSNGTVLVGSFDPSAIGAAYVARDYTSSANGGYELLCPAAGCDTGLKVDLSNIDMGNPFGGRLGRSEPLAVAASDLLSSADAATVDEMLAVADGSAASVADLGPYRAVASAAQDDLTIVQATLLAATQVLALGDPAVLIGESPLSPDELEALVAELTTEFEKLPPMSAPEAVAIIDGASPTEQVVTVALAYRDEAEATRAAEAVAERLASVRSVARDVPLSELFDARGVTSITPTVVAPGPDGYATAVVEVRAPLAGDEPTDSGGPAASSGLYRLFMQLIQTRDLLWITPNAEPA
jgi:hypothetical protein